MTKQNLSPVIYAALYINKKIPAEKVIYGRILISKMTDLTTSFPSPTPSLADYGIVCDNLDLASQIADRGSDIDKGNLEVAEGAFDIATRRLADYVQNTANAYPPLTARQMIVATGLQTRKSPEKSPVPEAVSTLAAIFTNKPGTIVAKWKGVKYGRIYSVYYSYTPGEADSWINAGASFGKSFTITGLKSCAACFIKVVAIGTNGRSPSSIIVGSVAI